LSFNPVTKVIKNKKRMPSNGKNAIITGSSKGIGLATVKALLNNGCSVAGWSRSKADFEDASFRQFSVDIADPASVEKAFHETLSHFDGRIDFLVNNAGIAQYGDFEKIAIEEWQSLFRVNVNGVFYVTRLVVPVMKKQESGHIINIASIAGLNGVKKMAGYSATKHALRGISHSLFMELREYGIKVTCIYPGSVGTGIADKTADFPLASNPMTPEDIAGTIVHVMNTSPNYLTVDVEIRPLKPKK
jgi:NADP-dependent 3-hydroxy acid dehydrogenase YdfG